MEDKQRIERARKKVGEIRDFYTHFFIFVVANSGLANINLLTTRDFPLVIFPLLGWGFAILIHGWVTFYADNVFGKEWEDRKVREILAREEGSKPKNREDYFEEKG